MAEIQSNKVTITVNPITTINSDVQSIWRAEVGESLVVTKTRETIDDTRTDWLKVRSTDNPLWLDSGYFKIDDEIIKYDSKEGNKLVGLTRGEFGTTPAAHGTKTYSFENGGEGFRVHENAILTRSSAFAHLGTKSLRIEAELTDGNDVEIKGPVGKKALPVTWGSSTISFWIYSQDHARSVKAGAYYFDEDGDVLWAVDYGAASTSTLGGWKQYSVTVDPESPMKYFTPVIHITNAAEGDRFYIDEVIVTNTRPKVREVRFYDIEYDQAPAIHVQRPFITAEIFDGFAEIESFIADTFDAQVLVSATESVPVGETVILEGSDPTTELENYFAIAGIPLVEEATSDEVEEISSELTNSIRRHRIKELTIENRFIQNKAYAQVVADYLIEHFDLPVPVMTLTATGVPYLQLGDRIRIRAFDQLDINDKDFWILETSITYDGGVQQSFTLREVS